MNIYCTYLTIYHGNKLPFFYIGKSTIARIAKGYNGSVESERYKSIWRSERKINPHLFKTRVLTTHSSKDEASAREIAFQKALGVIKNPLYINLAISLHSDGTGRKHSDETKRKMSKPKSEDHKRKIALALTGKSLHEDTKRKLSLANIGKTASEKTKQKLSLMRKGIPKSEEHKRQLSLARKRYLNRLGYIPDDHRHPDQHSADHS